MNNPNIAFLPEPRSVRLLEGSLSLPAEGMILLDVPRPQAVLFTATRFQQALQAQLTSHWQLTASQAIPADETILILRLSPETITRPEGYRLVITTQRLLIEAHGEAGLFYGINTLIQLIAHAGHSLPFLEIEDWPDFPARGVMLDISRDKVPQMSTLCDLIDRLASWKINQVQLYTEHTFAYRRHPEVWAQASPLTAEEILRLDAFCRERYIELVPNQNSFGHMHRWLRHQRYAPLAEKHGEITVPWGKVMGPYGLSPVQPGSLELVRGLYDELLPNFSSRMFNVGCDETFDLGQGQSKELVAQRGVGKVYLDYLREIYADVTRRGFTMQFWGDIIVQHPELVPELPQEAIGLLWGYEGNHPFDRQGSQFAAAGLQFYVCPGTSSWCSLAGRTQNAIQNLANAAENGLKHGASGFLNTDWGDDGHWQMLPVSFLGLAVGAAYGWCYQGNQGLDISRAVSRFAFDDRSEAMGKVAYALGDVYLQGGLVLDNMSFLFRLMQTPLREVARLPETKPAILDKTLKAIDEAIQPLSQERMARKDADLIRREFLFTARVMRHACYRGYLALESDPQRITQLSQQMTSDINEIIAEYRLLWLARNRPGGLEDSVRRFELLQEEYAARFLERFLGNKPVGDVQDP